MRQFSHFFLYLALLALPLASHAQDKQQADELYLQEKYHEAIAAYEQLLQTKGESASLYYNLGNAYYKNQSYGKAILNYERALLLEPNDKDARHNLALSRTKTVDQITPRIRIFLTIWIEALVNTASSFTWAVIGVASFMVLLLGVLCCLFLPSVGGRKAGFYGAIVSLVVCLWANYAGYVQYDKYTNRKTAIVMDAEAALKVTPDSRAIEVMKVHEGVKLHIIDSSLPDWCEVRLEDGKQGWILKNSFEII